MWTKLLHHASVLNEVWIEQVKDLDELKNRLDDFWKTNSNSMKWVPARLAFSSYPLIYKWTNEKILSLIDSWWTQFSDILKDKDNFYLDLTINSNPGAMFGQLAAINSEIIEKPSEALQTLFEKKIGQIVWKLEHTTVSSDNDIWVIVSDWTTEQNIPDYSYTFDKKVSAIEMWKTTVRKSWDLVLDWLVDWKQERFNTSINLGTLLNYFENYYTTWNNSDWSIIEWVKSSLKLIPTDETLDIWEMTISNQVVKSDYGFKRATNKYRNTDKERYKEYTKLLKKMTFVDWWWIQMKAKDLKLTPPVVLWLEKLIKEGTKDDSDFWSVLGNTMVLKNTEEESIWRKYENLMKEILNLEYEDTIEYSKIKTNWKFWLSKPKTPDYIELWEDKEIFIYDFKTWTTVSEYIKFENTKEYRVKYNNEIKDRVNVKLITLIKEKSLDSEHTIYYKDFFSEKWISLTDKQINSLEQLERNHNYQNSVFDIQWGTKWMMKAIII